MKNSITMKDVAVGLGVEPGDIIAVGRIPLVVREDWSFALFPDDRSTTQAFVAEQIINMLMKRTPYTVYKVREISTFDNEEEK